MRLFYYIKNRWKSCKARSTGSVEQSDPDQKSYEYQGIKQQSLVVAERAHAMGVDKKSEYSKMASSIDAQKHIVSYRRLI